MVADASDVPTDSNPSSASPDAAAPTSTPAPADPQAPASPTGETPASTPDAQDSDRSDREELLKVVQKVVKPESKTPSQGEAPAAPELAGPQDPAAPPKQPSPADAALEADPTETELAAYVPRTKARIEKLLHQRNVARTETENLRPAADKWQQFDGYLTQADLAPEDVNLLLGIGAALRRGDFKAFRDGVMPYVTLANEALGESLPSDLEEKVDNGELSLEAARELSVTRISNARLKGQAEAAAKQRDAVTAADTHSRHAQAVTSAVVGWEAAVRARDPDYALQAPAVLRISQALIAAEGPPPTPEAAVAMAQRAYDEARSMFAAVRPHPTATRPQPSGARAVNGTRPEPRNMMEHIVANLERYRAPS